ncbi:MAG: hypothetical protein KAS86_00995, partial [Candidatus Omnitrophica bacterium]|nr:hypothetical protein [Candidatus Omnitrophota bacterium]
ILVEQLKAYRDHFGAGIPEKTEETLIEQPGREDLRGYVRVEERDVTVPEERITEAAAPRAEADTEQLRRIVGASVNRLLKAAGVMDAEGNVAGKRYMSKQAWIDLWVEYFSRRDLNGNIIFDERGAESYIDKFVSIAGKNNLGESLEGSDMPDWLGAYFSSQVSIETESSINDEVWGILPDIFARMGYISFLVQLSEYNDSVGKAPADYLFPGLTAMDMEHFKENMPVSVEERITEDLSVLRNADTKEGLEPFLKWEKAAGGVLNRLETRTSGRAVYGKKSSVTKDQVEKYLGRDIKADIRIQPDDAVFLAVSSYMTRNDLSYEAMGRILGEMKPLKAVTDHLYGDINDRDIEKEPQFRVLRSDYSEFKERRLLNTARLQKTLFLYNAVLEYRAREIYADKNRGTLSRGEYVQTFGYDEVEVEKTKKAMTAEDRQKAVDGFLARYNNPMIRGIVKEHIGADLNEAEAPGFMAGDKVVSALLHSVIETEEEFSHPVKSGVIIDGSREERE